MADHLLAAAQTREPVAHRRAAMHLCVGEVMHARSRPVANRFSYPVFYLQMRMDDVQGLAAAQSWLFGLERSRPLSFRACLLYTSPSPRDQRGSRMPSSA